MVRGSLRYFSVVGVKYSDKTTEEGFVCANSYGGTQSVIAGKTGWLEQKLDGHITSALRKHRINRKWGWSIQFQEPPSITLPPARCHLLKVPHLPTAAPAVAQVFKHMKSEGHFTFKYNSCAVRFTSKGIPDLKASGIAR